MFKVLKILLLFAALCAVGPLVPRVVEAAQGATGTSLCSSDEAPGDSAPAPEDPVPDASDSEGDGERSEEQLEDDLMAVFSLAVPSYEHIATTLQPQGHGVPGQAARDRLDRPPCG